MNTRKSLIHHLAGAYEQYRVERDTIRLGQGMQPRQSGRLRRLVHWLTPNGGTLLLIAVLILTTNVWAKPLLSPTSAPGPSATTVNYQGRLADSGGSPLSGTYGMTFALYDAPTDGSLVWGPESHAAVVVSEGLFSVGLGSQTGGGIPTSVWGGDRYLEITVGGETLLPRELIRSVSIAGMALTVPDGSITDEKLDFRLPQLLGQETCDSCGRPTESVASGWNPVKGTDSQDIIEVTVTTRGGPIVVHMTSRYGMDPARGHWCGVQVSQGESQIHLSHLDGDTSVTSSDYGCSGTYVFPDLSAGTYTFRAMGYMRSNTTVEWKSQRQIAVYEF